MGTARCFVLSCQAAAYMGCQKPVDSSAGIRTCVILAHLPTYVSQGVAGRFKGLGSHSERYTLFALVMVRKQLVELLAMAS